MRLSKNAIVPLCSGFVVLLVLAVVFAGFRRATRGAQPGVDPPSSVAANYASDQARVAQTQSDPRTLADARDLIKRTADAPEPFLFSVEKTADQAGNNPAVLFTYVHDHVRTQIYSGVLRGARGTLISGAGNSWDQALLLATMLRHEGREVRFARVHLTPEMTARVVDRMFTDAARPRSPAGKPLKIPESLQNGSRAILAQIHADWQRAQTDLLQALDRANLSLGTTAISEPTLQSEAADHLFVEYHEGDRWIPLDPVVENAPGASVSSAAEHAAEIPDSFYHHVTIRVWIEQRRNQVLQQQEVLRFPTTAAALSGAQVLLSHKFDHDVAGGWRATPVLQIDGRAYAARTFNDSGLIAARANSNLAQAQQALSQVGHAVAMFGTGKAPAPGPAPASDAFTSESLEIEFTDPAKHSEIVHRELIDRIGAVARANKTGGTAPLTPITVANGIPLPLAGIYALAFATGPIDPGLPAQRLSSAARALPDLQLVQDAPAAQNRRPSPEDQERLAGMLDQFPALLQASAESIIALSQHLAQNLRIGDSTVVFYEVTPRLVIASFDLTYGLGLDLRQNGVRVFARKASPGALVRANLARSVADAAIEGDVLMPKAQLRRIAAIDIFNRARTQGIRLVALRSGGAVASVQASDLARARMANAEPGTVLIAPDRTPSASPPHFAWWKLDPSTGEAISTLDTGLNGFQDLPENAALESRGLSPMATTLSTPYRAISPMARTMGKLGGVSPYAPTNLGPLIGRMPGQGTPWSICGEFTGDMMMELLRALTAAGEDTSQLFL